MEGEIYGDGSTRVNKPCPKCGMSYLLEKDGVYHCNHLHCDYEEAVDITEHA